MEQRIINLGQINPDYDKGREDPVQELKDNNINALIVNSDIEILTRIDESYIFLLDDSSVWFEIKEQGENYAISIKDKHNYERAVMFIITKGKWKKYNTVSYCTNKDNNPEESIIREEVKDEYEIDMYLSDGHIIFNGQYYKLYKKETQ